MSNEKSEKNLKRGQRPEGWKNDCPKFKEYYAKQNPTWTEEQCKEAAKRFCRSINWQCIEFYTSKYPDKTLEECELLRKQAIADRKNNSPAYIQYYEKRFPNATHEEHLEMLRSYTTENCFQSLAYYEKRFPNATHEEHLEMLNTAKKSYLEKRPSVSGENNPMHKSKTTDIQRRQISPKCIEFYEKRFPNATHEEHLEMLNDHLVKVNNIMQDKTKQIKCVEYWLARGYNKKEARQIIAESQKTFSLEKCIEKYGLEEGVKRFEKRQEDWLKSLKNSAKNNFTDGIQTSTIANEFLNKLIKILNAGKKELIIGKYAYDFCYNNKIIEFNGDYWHMNPKIYNKNDINKTTGCTAKQAWDNDKKKIKHAKSKGYELITIWESDYRKNPDAVIKKCMEFLTS